LFALIVGERAAEACGGCFAPRDNPTVVTDHRMILSVSKTQSTLYDQIRYQGDPASFAWVLPFSGNITVGLSSDVLFAALDGLTQTSISPPPGCVPPPPSALNGSGSSGGSAGAAAAPDGVTVLKHEVVGPYDTVQLQATDPSALQKWLQTNGFNIPADVAPIIDTYVAEHFNFLALKLIPSKGIRDMRPVRVTTEGANVALPLRMVAAGTGATVGIGLWVVGEGRYEPYNFGWFYVDNNDLGWDRATNKSNYTDVRAKKTAEGGGAVWEIESSLNLARSQIEAIVRNGVYSGSSGAVGTDQSADYLPVKDAQGSTIQTAVQVRDEDMSTLFSGISAPRVTRMRADLVHVALNLDLLLRASSDQSTLSNIRQLTRCGLPSDPNSTVIHPGDPNARPPVNPSPAPEGGGETFACTAAPGSRDTWMTAGLGLVGAAIVRAVRQRQRSARK
jgi:hypothetical protein